MLNRGFSAFRRPQPPREIPAGQYYETGFPVLTYGPTERVSQTDWKFTIDLGEGGFKSWTWDDLMAMPQPDIHTDIHCVTKWSKLDTDWRGVTIDTLFEDAGIARPTGFVMAFCDGGYTTNLPVDDIVDGKGLLVPHLYLWKSAKWVRGLKLMEQDVPGFWEGYGYHMYGDPWREQRYTND